MDYNAESSFDAVRILCFIRAFYEELNWQSAAWMDDILHRMWQELVGEHDDVSRAPFMCEIILTFGQVRDYIADIMVFASKVQVSIDVRFLGAAVTCAYHSGGLRRRRLARRCLFGNVAHRRKTLTSWAYSADTTRVACLNCRRSSDSGRESGCPA